VRLSATDIRNTAFARRLRGFDPDEVQAFLAALADQHEQLERERQAAETRAEALERELERYRTMDQGLRDTLLEVRQSGEESRENARREAELIVREAEFKASRLLAEAEERRGRLQRELAALQQQRQSWLLRMRHLIDSQRELLEALSGEDEAPIRESDESATDS
jgi:cell division initiation protein